ncbi:MAG: N-6 DNA methylase [Helicobacter sp.]|nr:N-6 DNA methylase [Helicobacter sp.]
MENLLNAIKEHLGAINKDLNSLIIKHEPNNDKEGRGAPDFMILNQGLAIGYIENKRVNADLDTIAQSPQIEKYLSLSDNILLTDYLRFALVQKDSKGKTHIVQECRICELSQIKITLKNKQSLESKAQELLTLFTLFFTHEPKPINTALEFANALALRTRILKDTLGDSQANSHIANLYETFKEQLYKELNFAEFADSLAQTLTYSLFLARLNVNNDTTNKSSKEIDLYNVKRFIPKSFPLIRAMSGFLDNVEDLDSIKWLLEEILNIINHIDISNIIKELNKASQKDLFGTPTIQFTHKDPYLHFYETFLSQYDPKMREIRGVYYTPASVVSFIINAIDLTLKTDFKLKQGLSAALENPNITLLDFATGTGTFLLEAFRKALESIPKDSTSYNPKRLLTQFFGFEFLIAPYTIAHLKLSQSFKEEFRESLKDNERLGIYLTNTLYYKDSKEEQKEKSNLFIGIPELVQEALDAQNTKEKPILIITGNPPYSGASANKDLFEDNVRITYGLEPSEATLSKEERDIINLYLQSPNKDTKLKTSFKAILERKKLQNEKNPKWLLDDYVKFICFAESKIKAQESGIFAFISNNAFLDNPTFRGMRFSLLKSFDRIYILDLHGNARKKELSPDGSKDENVFDIMQGVSINIFIKNASSQAKASSATSCSKPLAKLYHYDCYGKRTDKYNFLYENTLDSITWQELNPQNPFYLFIPQNDALRAEYDKSWSVKDIFKVSSVGIVGGRDKFVMSKSDSKESLQEFKQRILRFLELDIESARKEFNLGKDSRDWKIEYAQKELRDTGNNPKSYVKIHYRPFDFRWTYYTGKSKGFHCMPRGEVMQHFLQNENKALLVSRQSSAVGDDEVNTIAVTDKMVDINFYRRGGEQVMPLYLIDSSEWVENFTDEFRSFIDEKYKEHFSPEQILGYIYAVLFHKEYREKYIDFLKIDFPKIPFVKSKEKFLALSVLGSKLISIHLLQNDELDSTIGQSFYKDRNNRNNTIEKIAYNEAKQELFVNESLYFRNVSKEVWEYKIGGYQVLDKYLKSHEDEKIDYSHFTHMIQTLSKSLELEKEIAKISFGD